MESDYNFGEPILYLSLSIHALRMESDLAFSRKLRFGFKLSIHALRMESDVLRPVTVRAFTKKHDGILSFAA